MRIAFELFESAGIAMVSFEVSQIASPGGKTLPL